MSGVLTLTCPLCDWTARQETATGDQFAVASYMVGALGMHLERRHREQLSDEMVDAFLQTVPASDPARVERIRRRVAAKKRQFLIWSIEHDAWWRPARQGYTESLAEAGVYDQVEAGEIWSRANFVKVNECLIPVECVTLLTSSQLLALTDIVAHYMLYPGSSDTFVDAVNQVDTHIEELLDHLLKVRGVR